MPIRQRRLVQLVVASIALLTALTIAACASPPGPSADGIEANDVWARAAKAGAMMGDTPSDAGTDMGSGMNSAVYMILTNSGDSADRLISAATEVAGAVELHETIMEGDVMKMQQVSAGIEVPAKGQTELKPGGLHVMLIGLTRDLNPGETIPVTLQFERAGALTVDAEVRQP